MSMKCPDDCLSREDYPYCTEGCRDESDFCGKCPKCGSEMHWWEVTEVPNKKYRVLKCINRKCGHEEVLSQ